MIASIRSFAGECTSKKRYREARGPVMEKYRLRDHQTYALEIIEANGSLLCAYDLGTGKSMIALAYIRKHLKRGDIKDALIICPASLVASWEQAIEECIGFEGFDSRDVEMLKEKVTIRSFQKTYKSTKVPVGRNGGAVTYRRSISIRDDIDHRWGVLVVDEAHQCSAHDAVQTKAAITLAKLSQHVISLTATPLHGGKGAVDYSKAYGEIQVVTKGTAFKNWSDFTKKAVTAYDRWYKPIAYNEPYCKKLMEDHSIVCRIEDCIDMPSKIEQTINCPLIEKTVYDDLKQGNIMKYGLDIQNAGGQYTKMLQVCSGSMKVSETSTMRLKTSKDDALGDIINGTDAPIVIFCNYRASIDHAEAVAKKAGRKVVVYDGRSKRETWKDFQAGKADCIVCQYQSGSAGLNLQNSAHMIMYEPCFSSLLLSQAKGRIYRSGQTAKKCVYYYLCTSGTLEKRVWDTVRSGQDVTEKLLADWAFKGMM